MKRLADAAREAGIHCIECPNCRKKFNTTDLFKRLFEGILGLVAKGERVNVPKFGIFHGIDYGSREHTSPVIPGGKVKSGPKRVLKFKQSANVRRALNPANEAAVQRGRKSVAAKKAMKIKQQEALDAMRERQRKAKRKASK